MDFAKKEQGKIISEKQKRDLTRHYGFQPSLTYFYNQGFIMFNLRSLLTIAVTLLSLFSLSLPVRATIVTTGDVSPTTPAAWSSSTLSFVGKSAYGEMTVSDGAEIISLESSIGSDARGIATIQGTASAWNIGRDLYVGEYGDGTLNILDGATVSVAEKTYVARFDDSVGSINFGTHGGTLITETLHARPSELKGTGTIQTQGLVSDIDLVFDVAHGATQTLSLNDSGQNIALNLNLNGAGDLGVGYKGNALMTINDGVTVASETGYVGVFSGSSGEVIINGSRSTWDNVQSCVGLYGSGKLSIFNGGAINNTGHGDIGYFSGSSGEVVVDGNGSTWSGEAGLTVGWMGNGTLSITNGGNVDCYGSTIGSESGTTGIVSVTGSGSVWNIRNSLTVGESGHGTLNINDHAEVIIGGPLSIGRYGTLNLDGGTLQITNDTGFNDWDGKLNFNSGEIKVTNGTVTTRSCITLATNQILTVDGPNSNWGEDNFSASIDVDTCGQLNIINGGAVNVYNINVDCHDGATGTVNFGSNGGTLTTRQLYASPTQLAGTGTINTQGIISDFDLTFDATHGLNQTILINSELQQNITLNLAPSGYESWYALGAGYSDNGSMEIRDGMEITSHFGYIGYKDGSSGNVTVDGTGSTWNVYNGIYVGQNGNGILNVNNGGTVIANSVTLGGEFATGTIHFGGNSGGILETGTLTASPDQLTGTGTINTQGLIGDFDLVFDANHGVNQTIVLNNMEQHININLELDGMEGLGVGYRNNASMAIRDGVKVTSGNGNIGHLLGSSGEATIYGNGSTWDSQFLVVGHDGSGILNITNGGLLRINSTLTIDNDKDGDSFINMTSGGMLALAGEANDSLNHFFNLIYGTNAIRWWDASLDNGGDWAPLTNATYGDDYMLEYFTKGDLAGYTVLTVGTMLEPGDANGDGMVDGSDVTILAGNWQFGVNYGETANWSMGDFNGDGKVDGSDVTILAANWQYGVAIAPTAVPEPTCITLFFTLLLTGLGVQRSLPARKRGKIQPKNNDPSGMAVVTGRLRQPGMTQGIT